MNLSTQPMPRENTEDENNEEFMNFYKKEVANAPADAEVISESITPFLVLYESIDNCTNSEDAEKLIKDYENALIKANTDKNGQLLRFLENHKINIQNIAKEYNIETPAFFSIILEKESEE